ncbi:hypothetical protein [Desulforhopalus sp. 52FAK]
MTTQSENCQENTIENQDRRTAVKKIAAGVGVLAGCSVLPERWTKPIVGGINLPAHAATSGAAPVAAEVTGTAEATEAVSTGGFNASETYSLRSFAGNDKRFTWLNATGASYGGQVKFEFNGGCGELVVPNAAVTHGADGNTSNHNQAFYFCGTDFAPGTKENNANRASVFAPPNCGATSVTMYYNK